jgi:catalase
MKAAQVKAEQLSSNTAEPSKESRITSDFGTKQSNTDDWLRVANGDKTGPSLLEDVFAREKVWPIFIRDKMT